MPASTCIRWLSVILSLAFWSPSTDGQAWRTWPVVRQRATDFTTDVIPILNKLGCNQGACHGAQHGKGGFRLSLLGFDPAFDYDQIVKSAEGRRVVPSSPERSLLLLKPTLEMEHGGGERLRANSVAYRVLLAWLEAGAPPPAKDAPTVMALEVTPSARLMRPGDTVQLKVLAKWSDGRSAEVTPTVQYDTLNEGQATVSESGLVTCKDRGETAVMLRYCGQAAVFRITSPFRDLDPYPALPTPTHVVDAHLHAKWKSLGLVPSGPSTDAEFLRRVMLDLLGTLPTPDEVRAFLADADSDKRRKLVDRLLERPEYIDYWTLKWGDLLRNNRDALQEKGMWSFHNWLRGAFRDNVPVDRLVREIITAEGSTFTNGPANFFRVGANANDWAENTAQVFLGVRLQCAKCHHHPFEKWSQDDYYGMSAFFVRMGTKNSQEFGLFGRETVVFLRPTGEQVHPRKGSVVKPRALESTIMDDDMDRRQRLAEWLTSKENSLFARNVANRYWGYLMGRGLVEPLDDMRATNPATNDGLLDALAAELVAHDFDVKHLIRTIVNSRAYGLASVIEPGNAMDKENHFHARYRIRRLPAEAMADALDAATGTREKYPGLPLGTRAIQLPDPGVRSYLLDVFGRPARQVTCECERSTTPNIAQALHLVNGSFINGKISRPGGRIDQLFRAKVALPQMVDELYLASLSRPPTGEERHAALELVRQAPTPRAGIEDLLWTLINTREFYFNH